MSWGEILTFAILLGLASSAHCAGMCGVFAVKAATHRHRGSFLAYVLGKAFTYAFLGALAGWFGARVLRDSNAARAYAAMGAALILIAAGLMSLLPKRRSASWTRHLSQFLKPLFSGARALTGLKGTFALGAVTGLLPCGIVYLAAVQAVLSGTIIKSIALMALVSVSTTPSLLLVGFLSGKIKSRLGPRTIQVGGAILLIAIGLSTAWRAWGPIMMEPGAATCCH